jgi:RNA polymerase sigma-70 factor (ECF subfamily)
MQVPTAVRAGGPGDLEDWLAAGYPRCYRTAWLLLRNRDDAQEVVQEAYLRVWRFRDAVPAGSGRDGWLYRVVVNAAISRLRRDKRARGDLGDDALRTLAAPAADGPEERAADGELSACVLAALSALPELLRVPVILRYYAQLSEKEIAVAIDRRPGTVKSRLYDARMRLAADPALAAWVAVDDERVETPSEVSS